jgi:kumamolisin
MYWAQSIPDAVEAAAKDGCDVCSISWGASEVEWGTAAAEQMEDIAKAATAKGMVILAASGDNDADDSTGNPTVDCPACCPHVIGCGGTSKPAMGMEMVWNNTPGKPSGEGTGGGYSSIFPPQLWQLGARPAPRGLGRMVPDVAADADPDTGYQIIENGQVVIVGGTSAVAPLYAGLIASAGKKLGWITPNLFLHREDFNNITMGDNGVYDAGPGADPCTGLGSPIGDEIVSLLIAEQPEA